MKLTRIQFRNRYKKPEALIEGKLLDWRRNVDLGNRTEVMLTEIPFDYHESQRHDAHTALLVTGYKIKSIINRYEPTVVAAYSPMVGGFIFSYSHYGIYSSGPLATRHEDEGLYSAIGLAYVPYTPEPLDDDTSRLVLMADCVPDVTHNLIQGYDLPRWLFKDAAVSDDMMLNLVSCIRQQPQERRDRLLSLYDRFGPPEGPLGEALTHIDKFRTF
jgi:hypothetical protein